MNDVEGIVYVSDAFSLPPPAGDQMGRALLGGGCLFGIGSLCYYGLGLSKEAGAIDRVR